MKQYLAAAALAAALTALSPPQVTAATVEIPSFHNGWYDSLGHHDPQNLNTFTGFLSPRELHGFFAFDISGAKEAESISITFLANEDGLFITDSGSETVGLFDYTGSIAALVAGDGGLEAFNDLGSGVQFGEHEITSPQLFMPMPVFTVTLSSEFVEQFNTVRSASDPRIALGAALLTISSENDQGFWAAQLLSPAAILTVVEKEQGPVPEPAGLSLLSAGLLGLCATARRRRRLV